MSKAKTLLDFALSYIAENKELFPDFSGEAPKKHHRLGGILLGSAGVSRGQSASITGDAFKAEFDKYIKEMSETADEVKQLIDSTGAITEEAKKATSNANIATESANKATENANNAGTGATTAKENAEQATEQAKVATANANSAAQRANDVIDNLETGYYPSMSVGMADNLVGRGDVQDAQINFRPSAGDANITDHAARIERIKGNSVVYNQHCNYKNVPTTTTKNGVTFVNNGDGSFIVYTEDSGATANTGLSIGAVTGVAGHTLIMLGCPDGCSSTTYHLKDSWSSKNIVEDFIYSKSNSSNTADCRINIVAGTIISEPIIFRPRFIDLTQMYGAGNEPTTVEEYYQRKPMNIEDEYAYNAGTLVDMKVDSLISTSDNAYDYTKGYARVMGGQTYDCSYGTAFVEKVYFSTDKDNIVAEENAMTSENGKYVFPSDGYVVPYTTDGDVREYCVCLQHSYTKPHPAYQQEVKDLSFIGEEFPEGMRSAGSAFDEIRFNPTKKVWEKIVSVGVRAYAEGDAEDSSVTTDGKTTNYPLDNPTPTTIDLSPNFNLDYFAWDFGTEEAIASVPSAPFRADINYEPNAVDDLRWAVSEIRNLKAQLAQMSASVTNLTE
jgi:hypothetical protein